MIRNKGSTFALLLRQFKWTLNERTLLPVSAFKSVRTFSNNVSHIHGPKSRPLLEKTVGDVIREASDNFGDDEAVVSCHQRIRKTYSELQSESECLAAGFVSLGLEPGDKIGIWSPNNYEWVLTSFAAAKAGLILVNINPAYKANELKFCVNKVSMKCLIFADKFKTTDYLKTVKELLPEIEEKPGDFRVSSQSVPSLEILISLDSNIQRGILSLKNVLDAPDSGHVKKLDEITKKISSKDPFNIQFTSGTTGLPKAALLSHHNLVNNAYFVGLRCRYDEKPLRICLAPPLFHCLGSVCGVLAGALNGCCIVFAGPGFDAKEVVDSFFDERIHSCYGTPTMFVDIIKEYQKRNKNGSLNLFTGIMAGAPCPQQLVDTLINDLGMTDFITMYGMTETSPVTLQCHPSDSPELRSQTVGCVSDWTEVKIVDEKGSVTPIGEVGELCIRGYCNFLGYLGDDEKTKEIMTSDGWLKTGDLVTMNPNGYGTIRGRIKDMIIRGGENIYPAELENFYMSHPDVIEAQVFGVPDERLGEEVGMWVRLTPDSRLDEEKLKNWSRDKIAHYKIPKYIKICSEFPRTTSGKIQKFKMKEATIKEIK